MSNVNLLRKHSSRVSNSVYNKNERIATTLTEPPRVSTFNMSRRHLTTFNNSKLVPIFFEEVLPGDTWNINVSALIRMSTPQAPTMENPKADIAFFFVPNNVVFPEWKYLMGETKNAGFQPEISKVPTLNYGSGVVYKYTEGDLASYLGIPINVDMSQIGVSINSLPFKGYIQIWNDWYRDENLQSEFDNTNNNRNTSDVNVSSYWGQDVNVSLQVGKGLAPVSRLPDYFSTCLPWAQKGNPLDIFTSYGIDLSKIGLTGGATGQTRSSTQLYPFGVTSMVNNSVGNGVVLNLPTNSTLFSNAYSSPTSNLFPSVYLSKPGDSKLASVMTGADYASGAQNGIYLASYNRNGGQFVSGINSIGSAGGLQSGFRTFLDLSRISLFSDNTNPQIAALKAIGDNSGFSVNDLRGLIALQHFQELNARGGTRYVEFLRSHFGVKAPDDILYRSQYIGGFRHDVSIDNVIQSSNGTPQSPLGSIGGYSVTGINKNGLVTYSAKVHGYLFGMITVRPIVSYSQGLPKCFTRTEMLDFYLPDFANIGEQPVYNYELYLQENSVNNNQRFGFQEAWATYRYSFNKLTGYMSVNSTLSMSNLYSYTEKYTSNPVLNGEWMKSNGNIISSTLMLNSNQLEFIHDFLADFYFNVNATRPLPVQSIPGLNRI